MQATEQVSMAVGVSQACRALGVARSALYRQRQADSTPAGRASRPPSVRALTPAERDAVRALLNSERFVDHAPRTVYATLLDEGQYLCSWRTMYRILEEHAEVRERRNQRRHPVYQKPELLATAPRQLWSWDITKLKGPVTWHYYYLYVILDVFSRYVVGWLIAERETATLAHRLIEESCRKEDIAPDQLVLHSDRGAPMTSHSVAELLATLGVTKSLSRPSVSNDNPFSEAHFKTVKYQPTFPERFGSLEDALTWARLFFHWYNHEHYHSALGLMTPAAVHLGQADALYQQRQRVLQAAYQAHPERFVRGLPIPPTLPTAVWINPPTPSVEPLQLLAKEVDDTQFRLTNFSIELSQTA
jgi:putative transposase